MRIPRFRQRRLERAAREAGRAAAQEANSISHLMADLDLAVSDALDRGLSPDAITEGVERWYQERT